MADDVVKNPPSNLALGSITKQNVLQRYANIFEPGRGKPFGNPMHIQMDPSVTPGVINIADYICIFGCGDTIEDASVDHDRNLVSLLDKCSYYDLHLSAKTLQFKATSVTFMGHRLTDKGLEPDPAKISAITEMHGVGAKLVYNAS